MSCHIVSRHMILMSRMQFNYTNHHFPHLSSPLLSSALLFSSGLNILHHISQTVFSSPLTSSLLRQLERNTLLIISPSLCRRTTVQYSTVHYSTECSTVLYVQYRVQYSSYRISAVHRYTLLKSV